MQPILVDRGQFVPERFVEVIDDTRLASHDRSPAMMARASARLDYNDYNLWTECAKALWQARADRILSCGKG
jgi:hypothetical protein